MKQMIKELIEEMDGVLTDTRELRKSISEEFTEMRKSVDDDFTSMQGSHNNGSESLREVFVDGFNSIEVKLDELSEKIKGTKM